MMTKPNISVELCGLRMSNPTMLASGILGETAASMIKVASNGAGAIVTKSISLKACLGYPNPTFVECEHGLLNAMGLPNPGIDDYKNEMKDVVKDCSVPVIASVFGATAAEFITLSKKMEKLGASALELNLSCPHAKGYGAELGCDPLIVEDITRAVCSEVEIPVFVKITPNIASLVDIAKAVERGGGDAVVAINTVRGMKIDTEMRIPVLHNKIGGYSGPAIKPVGVRAVYEIYGEIKIPIIGCGGISTGEDAIEYFLAGASAIQIGSAVYYRGVGAFREICDEIKDYMNTHKVRSIHELVGVAKEI